MAEQGRPRDFTSFTKKSVAKLEGTGATEKRDAMQEMQLAAQGKIMDTVAKNAKK